MLLQEIGCDELGGLWQFVGVFLLIICLRLDDLDVLKVKRHLCGIIQNKMDAGHTKLRSRRLRMIDLQFRLMRARSWKACFLSQVTRNLTHVRMPPHL